MDHLVLFKVTSFMSGYKLERHDRNIHGGGIAAFIRTDIPARRRHDLECKNLENIIYKISDHLACLIRNLVNS
jgi:hypothetical protein